MAGVRDRRVDGVPVILARDARGLIMILGVDVGLLLARLIVSHRSISEGVDLGPRVTLLLLCARVCPRSKNHHRHRFYPWTVVLSTRGRYNPTRLVARTPHRRDGGEPLYEMGSRTDLTRSGTSLARGTAVYPLSSVLITIPKRSPLRPHHFSPPPLRIDDSFLCQISLGRYRISHSWNSRTRAG